MGFTTVYSKATGRPCRVPDHYLDNPVLAKAFRKTPKTRAAAQQPVPDATAPGTSSTPTHTETPAAGD